MEPETRVRQESAMTLGRIGGDEVIAPLLAAMRNDPMSGVRWRAAQSLSKVGDVSLVGAMKEARSKEEDPRAREYIEDAIATLEGP